MEKTTKLVSLFAATVLVAGTALVGCGDEDKVVQQQEGICYDDDDNGYCDDSDDVVDSSYGFIYVGSHKRYYKKGYYPGNDGKVYRSAKRDQSGSSSGGSSSGTGKNGSGSTVTPPKSSSGTGTVVSPGKSTSGSSNTGISSGSKGGIGSSSSSSSS